MTNLSIRDSHNTLSQNAFAECAAAHASRHPAPRRPSTLKDVSAGLSCTKPPATQKQEAPPPHTQAALPPLQQPTPARHSFIQPTQNVPEEHVEDGAKDQGQQQEGTQHIGNGEVLDSDHTRTGPAGSCGGRGSHRRSSSVGCRVCIVSVAAGLWSVKRRHRREESR